MRAISSGSPGHGKFTEGLLRPAWLARASSGDVRLAAKDSKDGSAKVRATFVEAVAGEVAVLNRSECPAASDLAVWDVAIIEPYWDKPWIVMGMLSQLLDCQR